MALQLSLLPDKLPDIEGVEMCARYLPTAGGEVGGDWYDVSPLDDGRLALVIGDVSGHGLEAAGTMGELRSILRAYLLDADSPADVLDRLNRMVLRVLPATFATCLVAMLRPGHGRGQGGEPRAPADGGGRARAEPSSSPTSRCARRSARRAGTRAPRTQRSRSRAVAGSCSTPTASSSGGGRSSTAAWTASSRPPDSRARSSAALRRARGRVPRPRSARRRDRARHPPRMSAARLGPLRGDVPRLGHPVPVHQGRGRRRHAARVHRLGARHARGRDPARARQARRACCASLRGKGRWLLVYALVEIVVPFPLIAAGEQHVSSGLAAILIAAVPLFIALLAIRFDPEERATGSRLVGLVVGLVGVVVLMGIDVAGDRDELLGAVAILIAALGYAIGPMTLKAKLAELDPRATMGASLLIAALVLTPFAAADLPDENPGADAIASLLVLGVVCTALAFVIFGALIAEIGPGRALVITYVNPVVAVALGVIVLDERPGAGAIAGLLLIIAGSWLSTDGRLPPFLSRRRRPAGRTPLAHEG